MGTLGDFLNPKVGGRKRREWLDGKSNDFGNMLQYYAGPGVQVENLATIGDALNPISDIQRAGQNAQLVAKGDMGAMVPMVTDMASVLAPGAAVKYAGGKATNAVVESLLGVGQPTRKGLQKAGNEFAKSEDGGASLDFLKASNKTGAQTEAQTVLDMLKSGRGADVTDDMMSKADDAYLFNNYDLPMDEASRMGRAGDAGFDIGTPLFHGTAQDFPAFDGSFRGGVADAYTARRADWLTDSPLTAGGYADMAGIDAPVDRLVKASQQAERVSDWDLANELMVKAERLEQNGPQEAGQALIPAYSARPSMAFDAEGSTAADFDYGMRDAIDDAKSRGDVGAEFTQLSDHPNYGIDDPALHRGIFDPRNIRSKFARFDPRLKHLSNLSASVAGGGLTIGAALRGQDDDERTRQTLK